MSVAADSDPDHEPEVLDVRGRVRYLLVAPALAGMLLAGCGSADEPEKKAKPEVVSVDTIDVKGEKGKKPKLDGFEGPVKFDETDTKVIDEGSGPKVEEGQNVEVNYIGFNARNGKSFDDSWQRGEPATFPLKKGAMINGFVEGLVGQQVGSRVVVGIPSKDGYPDGNGAEIKKGDSLIFVVELEEARTPLTTATGDEVEPSAELPVVEVNDKNEVTGIQKPKGDPPKKLVAEPLIEGDGDKVTEQSTVQVHALAVNWDSGKSFESTWEKGEPIPMPLAQVSAQIPGLGEGLVGRKVGDRMLLVLPPDKGLGQDVPKSDVKKDSTTVWVVDILDSY